MKTYRFHFNTKYAADLREAVNDRQKQSINNVHTEKETKGSYFAWNRTCAAMDRLEDTLSYLNSLELGKNKDSRSAFDFYDFINNAYIVIDCIKTIGKIFRIDNGLIEKIEKSAEVFGDKVSEKSTDHRYFEYVRALCSVHPLCTNHQNEFLGGSQFHSCPFVIWDYGVSHDGEKPDLTAIIYPSGKNDTIYLGLYISQFEEYLTNWIDLIPKIIEAKNTYTDKEYEKLRQEHVKHLSEYNNDVAQYLSYLKNEYCKRFDYGSDYIFDDYIYFFTIKLSDQRNNTALEKYQNAVVYSLKFLRNELQNMSYEGYENNGIEHPERWLETTLFESLYDISLYDSAFSPYGYCLGKIYHLNSAYGGFDKMHARRLLEEPKELINKYVHFTNTEPDVERYVLVRLALYLDALSRNCFLNKNIPNKIKYRLWLLTQEKLSSLYQAEPIEEYVEIDPIEIEELIEKYSK